MARTVNPTTVPIHPRERALQSVAAFRPLKSLVHNLEKKVLAAACAQAIRFAIVKLERRQGAQSVAVDSPHSTCTGPGLHM